MNILEQIAEHNIIKEIIGSDSIHYIDYPIYLNIGDHLITHGTFDFFEKNNVNVKLSMDLCHYHSQWKKEVKAIVFSGGGNFGDIWRNHSEARLNLIRQMMDKKVLILPQTIRYSNDSLFERDCEILSKHKNLYICTRDSKSFNYARLMTDKVFLLPDMAINLWEKFSVYRDLIPSEENIDFFRLDVESALSERAEDSVDWNMLLTTEEKNGMKDIQKRVRRLSRYKLLYFFSTYQFNIWRKNSWNIVDRLARELSKYSEVHTDRLHVMMLFYLMGRRVTFTDNNNDKLSLYYQKWFS